MYEPDPDTIASARAGDVHAFGQIVGRYQADAIRLATHLVRDRTLAEDAVQEAFVRAFRFLRRYRGDSRFSTWLFVIVRNCSLDEVKKAGKRATVQYPETELRDPDDPHLALEVRDAIRALPLGLRETILLVDMLGMPYRDVAEMLDLPEGTIKSRVHRARRQLAMSLDPALGKRADEA